jgi:S-adenosylmethionine/arginine decarboxylase-like enzyme
VYDGYEGLVMWAESGAQLYTWERFRAVTVDIFSCKEFAVRDAVEYTTRALAAEQIAWKEIEPVLKVGRGATEYVGVSERAAVE